MQNVRSNPGPYRLRFCREGFCGSGGLRGGIGLKFAELRNVAGDLPPIAEQILGECERVRTDGLDRGAYASYRGFDVLVEYLKLGQQRRNKLRAGFEYFPNAANDSAERAEYVRCLVNLVFRIVRKEFLQRLRQLLNVRGHFHGDHVRQSAHFLLEQIETALRVRQSFLISIRQDNAKLSGFFRQLIVTGTQFIDERDVLSRAATHEHLCSSSLAGPVLETRHCRGGFAKQRFRVLDVTSSVFDVDAERAKYRRQFRIARRRFYSGFFKLANPLLGILHRRSGKTGSKAQRLKSLRRDACTGREPFDCFRAFVGFGNKFLHPIQRQADTNNLGKLAE